MVSHTRITTTCVDCLRPSLLYLRCRESKGSPEIGNVPPPLGNEQIDVETMVNGAIELIEAHYGTECNGTMYQSRLDIWQRGRIQVLIRGSIIFDVAM